MIYLVKFGLDGKEIVTEVKAKSYADAVSKFPSWIAVTKKPKDGF